MRIPVNRVAVVSVVPGSVGVYFYLLQRAPSAPLNEYGVEEAYAYLDSAFTSGTPKNWPRQRLRSRAFLTQPCSRHAGAPIPGGRVFVYAGLAYRRPGRLRASAATVRPDLLDQPTCCQLCSTQQPGASTAALGGLSWAGPCGRDPSGGLRAHHVPVHSLGPDARIRSSVSGRKERLGWRTCGHGTTGRGHGHVHQRRQCRASYGRHGYH